MTLDRSRIDAFFSQKTITPIVRIDLPEIADAGVNLWIKRDDLVHELVSGNKFRKLKYNVLQACDQSKQRLLSFGGAYSNHIHALAALGALLKIETIGVIRGDELQGDNPTLNFAKRCGMKLHFVSRSQYREKNEPGFLKELERLFGDFYLIPEGGSNAYAVQGCLELAQEIEGQIKPDIVTVACGTGGTLAGLASGLIQTKQLIGFPVLKGAEFLQSEIQELIAGVSVARWELIPDYHFGGYAKLTSPLADFISDFRDRTGIRLDPVYTGKMIYGVLDMIAKGAFPRESNIVAIHTGGLQGLDGMQKKLARLNQ